MQLHSQFEASDHVGGYLGQNQVHVKRGRTHGFEVVNADDYPGLVLLQDTAGIIGPAGLPDDVLAVLAEAHQAIMQDEGFLASLEESVYIVDPADPETYRSQLMADYENFGAMLGR